MSLDLYSSLMQSHQPASTPPPPPPPPKSKPLSSTSTPNSSSTSDVSSVEQRLLEFFPTAPHHTTPPTSSQPVLPVGQPASAAAGSASRVVPPTPKLLSALHSRTPSISPFARMGLDYVEEMEAEAGRSERAVKPVEEEECKVAEESGGVAVRDVKQTTAELVYATRQRRSTLRDKQGHSRQPSSVTHRPEEVTSMVVAPMTTVVEQRGRRIISNARMMNAANRPVLQTAAPLSLDSPLSPPPPPAATQHPASPAADPESGAAEEVSVSQKHKKNKPSAFLSQLAGLIKTPMTAVPPAIPRYHAVVEAAPDAQQPASPTAATAAAAIEQTRAALAAKRQSALPDAASVAVGIQQSSALSRVEPKQTESGAPLPKPDEAVDSKAESRQQFKPAVTPAVVVPVTSPPATDASQLAKRDEQQEVQQAVVGGEGSEQEDDDSWDDSEDDDGDEDDDAESSDSSASHISQQRIASDSDSDTFMRSLSSMWSTAKRRQDKQLAKDKRQTAERAEQQRMYGKTLVNGGVIVEREGGRMRKEVRRAVRTGKRRDGAKLTLEERKAMKMAAVYKQQGQKLKTSHKQEEKREQEDARNESSARSLTPQAAIRVLTAPTSTTSRSSPSSPRRRNAPDTSAAPFVPVRYDAPAMVAEPLPARPQVEVAFGRNTALTLDEAARRKQKPQRRGPSLFDLAYGSAPPTTSDADTAQRKRTMRNVAEEDDTAVPHSPSMPVVLPARVLRVLPPVSSHVITEGVAAGLPFSIRAIRQRPTSTSRTATTAATVPVNADVAAMAQQAIRQHRRNTPPTPSTATNTSTLSNKAVSFPRAPRSPQPSRPAQPVPSSEQTPAKRPQMAAKTKAHLDRLHAAHLEQQQRLQRERQEKEDRALEGCTFAPQLAAKSERMAERKRMQDEVQMRLYDMLKGRKQREREARQQGGEAEDDAPITWGWQDADQPSPAPAVAADGLSSNSITTAPTPGSVGVSKRDKPSRADVMYAQHRIQQERLRELKQLEDEQKAQEEVAQCTFVPHTNYYGSPAVASAATHTSAPQVHTAAASSPVDARVEDDPPTTVPPMVVQKMHTSYDAQYERESRRQSREADKEPAPQQQQPAPPAQPIYGDSLPASQQVHGAEVDEDADDGLFATSEASTTRSAAPTSSAALTAASAIPSQSALDSASSVQSSDHPTSGAWAVPEEAEQEVGEAEDVSQPPSADADCSDERHPTTTSAHVEEESESIHSSFAWAVPSFTTDTGDEELQSPVQAYPEVVEADDWQRAEAAETDDELDELLNTTELAQFRSTLLAQQLPVANIDAAVEPHGAANGPPTAAADAEPVGEAAVDEQGDAGGSRPLLYVDIALSADRVERMQLCDGDDLLQCASDFCAKHELHADYVPIIYGALQRA